LNSNLPKRILVVATRRIGDVLLTTPLIRTLKHAWPQAEIHALVFTGTEGVLAANPDLSEVLTIPMRPSRSEHVRFLFRIWRRYDIALSVMPSDRPTLYAGVAGKLSIGIATSGTKHLWKRWLLSRSVEFDNTGLHTVLLNLRLADSLGLKRCHEVVAAWHPSDEATVHKALDFDCERHKYVVLHIHPMYAYKAWHHDAWIDLVAWIDKAGYRIVLTGGNAKEEVDDVNRLARFLPRGTVNLTGRLKLPAVAYLLSKAQAYVGPDTVVTHLAAATGTQTMALFGPSNPVKWGPWPRGYDQDKNPYTLKGSQQIGNVFLMQGSGECVPCMEEGCNHHLTSLSDCLQQLPVSRVIEALQEMLGKPLPE
jgi:heptosyltransferase-3